MKKARYVRVSSGTQNTIRQTIKQHPDEQVFIDVISGAVAFNDRPQAQLLIEAIEAGTVDYLTVESIDRIGRDAFNIQSTIQYLNSKSVNLKVENLGIESFANNKPNPIFKMIADVLANVAELTRNNIRESQAQGIAVAVAQGKFRGRVKGTTTSDKDFLKKYDNVVKELKAGVNSLRKIAKLTDTSLSTVTRVKTILDKNEKGIN
ncbi:recombinase family protein [Flavobacterium hibernum]|uniref:Transposase n=1 Tax=Flavobacterium hibernum TaxID=37752 RepID=A0A0D0EDP5_9FLAO|nr:recombinase family protein [Flavobacterium hibernum]KIO50964.1 transposase [Flavobacterium hibernum]OXA85208.1 transposase [Flavobacterium hibernum]STO11340.1 Putative transposon Tn552 DNA-invertase bin3 [Flavobacterium hibernum]